MPWDPFKDGGAKEEWNPFTHGGAIELESDEQRREAENRWKWGGKNVVGLAAQGALDQGAGSTAEGAVRLAGTAQAAGAKGPEYAKIGGVIGELERAEMQAPNPQRQAQIAQLRSRMAELEQAAAPRVAEIQQATNERAGKVGEFRQAVREVYPVDRDVQESIPGQVVQGVGQAVAGIPAYLTGLGVPASAAQMFEQGFSAAKAKGQDDATAIEAGALNLPGAVLEQLGDKLQLGGLVKALRQGNQGARAVVKQTIQGFVGEAGTEGAQQILQNAGAKALYDPKQELLAGAGEAALVGGLTGATVAAGASALGEGLAKLDTGRNVPETQKTLLAQQAQLLEGRRAAQMFPEGTAELDLPAGMARLETERGVFHYDPRKLSEDAIRKVSTAGRENEILGLGPDSKADVEKRAAATGEPLVAVSERMPDGTEVKTAAATTGTAPATAATLNATKTPGNTVQVEPIDRSVKERRGTDLVGDLLRKEADRMAAIREQQAREILEREKRQRELAEKKARFDERLTIARQIFANPEATFPEVNGALESVKFYAEDNALGLDQGQRQLAARAQAALTTRLEGMKAAEETRRQAEQAQREQAANALEAQQRAQRTAAKQEFKTAAAAGIAPDGSLDYQRLNDDRLAELAQAGDRRAERTLMERSASEGETREDLLSTLRQIKLPVTDPALGSELKMLLTEEMTPRQRMQLTSQNGQDLDRVAQALRERGFSSVQTPADVIDAVQRSLRGERILPEGIGPQVEFAAGTTPRISETDVEREIAAIREAFPHLVQENDLQLGNVQRALQDRGYRGPVPDQVQAAIMRIKGQRTLIVLSARAYRDRAKGAALLTHEMAHPYWDTLPVETKAELREMHAREVATKTGPLYRDGKLQSELDFVEDLDENGHKEWFAERIARLNEQWAKGEIDTAEAALFRRLAHRLREFVRKVWAAIARREGVDPDSELFVSEFRRFFATGGDTAIARRAGAAYARRKGVEFAQTPPPDDLAQTQQRYDQLRDQFDQLAEEAAQIRSEINGLWESTDPNADSQMRARHDELQDNERATKAVYAELAALRQKLESAAPTKAKLPEGKTADQIIAEVARVEALPKVDRKEALLIEWRYGKRMRDAAIKAGNSTAETEGQQLVNRAKQRLDDEFPGWEKEAYAKTPRPTPTPPPAAPEPAAPDDFEASPFGEPDKDMPVRAGKLNELYGNSGVKPTFLARKWEQVRDILRGIKGSVPEIPTFAAASWNKTDRFIREHGPNFYSEVRAFYRKLAGANDWVQRTAEDDVAAITKPLIAAGGRFDANDYARLQRLQKRARELAAEKKPVPAGLSLQIAELNSKLESHPYVLFNRLALLLDLNWRYENLKDSQGNPIALPAGVNGAELKAELTRLGNVIAASDHEAIIRGALEKHLALVKRVATDLQDRELMAAEQLQNPFYFPHITLEVTVGDKTRQRELRPQRIKPGTEADFRGYLITPVGSRKAIETDYVNAMYYHLVQVGAHNLKADAVRDHIRPYDIMEQVRATAQAMAKQRGVPVSWEQAFHEEYEPRGYVLYGTDSRDAFPTITIDRDKLARRLGVMLTSADLQKQLNELGLKGVKLLPEDLQETLQQGTRETWIVPARVAEALRGIADRQSHQDNAVEKGLKALNSTWKAWKLFMPWNHFRYEYGNVIADLEKLMSASPVTFKYLPSAAQEIRTFWMGGEPTEELRAALRENVINTITANEMAALQRQPNFRAFETWNEKLLNEAKAILSAPAANATRLFKKDGLLGRVTSVEESAFREAIFRYAKFKGDLQAIRAGARPNYAGAYWRDIEAMQDTHPGADDAAIRKAAAISKATFGDYGDLSVTGQYVRDKLIPFYSWMEINFRYHANLLRNLRDMVRAGEASHAEAARAGARAAAVFGAGFTARAAGGLALRLSLPYLAVQIWNNLGDREELEELLSDEDRRRFHIIVGESKDGNTTLRDGRKIEVIYANTAFMDVMKWFSGPRFTQSVAGWLSGREDFVTAFSAWRDSVVPDFINNTVGSVGPLVKIPYTLIAKKSTFPDVLDQRTIPAFDMRRAILSQVADEFTADQIERVVNKDYYGSKDLGDWARQLILQVRQRDPEAWAFYEIKDKAADFVERKTGRSRDNSYNDPDQQVLRNFRRAIFRGDLEKATQFYVRLLENGYTAERFADSIRAQDPLSSLPKENGLRRQFVESLPPVDREMLQRAYAYYERINASRGREAQLFPRKATGERGLDRYRAQPRTEALQRMMERAGNQEEEELMRRADAALRASLRR